MNTNPDVRAMQAALLDGQTVEFEGVPLRAAADQSLTPGATYIAGRNTGPHLLTVERVVAENNLLGGYVIAKEPAYAFDIPECVVVELAETE